MQNIFFDEKTTPEGVEFGNTKKEVKPKNNGLLPPDDFLDVICTDEISAKEFAHDKMMRDNLVVVPDREIVGKGVEMEIDRCDLYFRKADHEFKLHVTCGDEIERYSTVPHDIIIAVVGEAEEICIVLPNPDGASPVYQLTDDVVAAIYIETRQHRLGNRYFVCVVYDKESDNCHCAVTADPNEAHFLYNSYCDVVYSE